MNINFENQIDQYIKQKRYPLINSILVYQYDELIAERYYNKFTRDSRNNIMSIWKSILSILTGICLDKGMIRSLEDPISIYLPEFNKNIHSYHPSITIRHLLTMTSGIYWNGGRHYHCPMYTQLQRSPHWLSHLADIAMANFPGTKFTYKEWDVILLSALIASAAGMNTFEFCNKFLYKPLGIKSGRWWQSRCGLVYNIGTNDIEQETSNLSAMDLAKLGNLFLHDGIWNGERILSKEYIKQTVTPSSSAENYGFLWWLFEDGYGCRGFGGQEINVIPKRKLVYVLQAKVTPSGKSFEDVFTEVILKSLYN